MFEIEHKYTVKTDDWRQENIISCHDIEQFYISVEKECTVRVRRVYDVFLNRTQYVMTIKSSTGNMLIRRETEVLITIQQYNELSAMSKWYPIKKIRYSLFCDDHPTYLPTGDNALWEIDVFTGSLYGLVVAEIEVPAADIQIVLPDWIDTEVTYDYEYTNSYLATNQPIKEPV